MIGKIIIGKCFKGCINYCLSPKKGEAERAEVIHYNNCYGDKSELVKQFQEVQALNPKLGKPVMHVILSLAPGDTIKPGLLQDIAQECAADLGFQDCQYLAISHNDTKHQHIHIIANRVQYSGKTLSDSHNYRQIVRFCRKMEHKHDLKKVMNPYKWLSPAAQLIERIDTRKIALKHLVSKALLATKDFSSFVAVMKSAGVTVEKARGIAFIDAQKVRTKGSEIGFSLQVIERHIARKSNNQYIEHRPRRGMRM